MIYLKILPVMIVNMQKLIYRDIMVLVDSRTVGTPAQFVNIINYEIAKNN